MIDSHCHLHHAKYQEDRNETFQRAREVGVRTFLVIGCDEEDSKRAVEAANAHPDCFATVGIHPHEAKTQSANWKTHFKQLCILKKVVAIGEMGLDYFYMHSDREKQISCFEDQLQLARELDYPVVIHTREAEEDTKCVLQNYPNTRGHVHCFTGSMDLAQHLLAAGYHLGFTGIITFKQAQDLREVVKATPLDRILIETDAPYLAPVPHRGKRNEPAFLPHIAEAVAQLKNVDLDTVIKQTTKNFYHLYNRVKA